jgi:hypothetical protein
MNKLLYIFLTFVLIGFTTTAEAGNPDRQGEAGAYELLMNPWARSAGLHTMTTAMISGVEAIRLNPAGLARVSGTEIVLGSALYLKGTDINMNAVGLAQSIGKNGSFGLTLMALDFGDINITTVDQPEGTGATFSPSFFNLGLSYSHIFENKVSVGITARVVSETISDARASAVTLDAGVQYVTGDQDNFKFGISLRNIGGRMAFEGDGLISAGSFVNGADNIDLSVEQRAEEFELQSMLNIGASLDFYVGAEHRITVVGNYTSNAFSQDQIGGGVEYAFNKLVMIRGGYRHDFGHTAEGGTEQPIYSGPAAGVTLAVPVNKEDNAPRIAIDYGYRATDVYDGTHNLSVRINLVKERVAKSEK